MLVEFLPIMEHDHCGRHRGKNRVNGAFGWKMSRGPHNSFDDLFYYIAYVAEMEVIIEIPAHSRQWQVPEI